MVARGEDPRERRRADKIRAELGTFGAVAAEFLEKGATGKPSYGETKRIIEKELIPVWGLAPIETIGRRDVVGLLDLIVARPAPVMANRTLGVISRIFSWALDRGIVDAHPCARMKKPGAEYDRERVLAEAEIRKLWKAWDEIGYPFGPLFQLLLVTAQRRGEVAGMARDSVDCKAAVWTLGRTKAGHGHEVPLSPLASEILGRAPIRIVPEVWRYRWRRCASFSPTPRTTWRFGFGEA
jgi:integrase